MERDRNYNYKNPNQRNKQNSGWTGRNPHSGTRERSNNGGGQRQACIYCHKTNHTDDACYFNPNQNLTVSQRDDHQRGNQGVRGGQSQGNQGPQKQNCTYCHKAGHITSRCFKNPNSSSFKGDWGTRNSGGTKMNDSILVDEEFEERRCMRVYPAQNPSGLKFVCQQTGLSFDSDTEGDVIMLEAVPLPHRSISLLRFSDRLDGT